jgi:hypothetical protein
VGQLQSIRFLSRDGAKGVGVRGVNSIEASGTQILQVPIRLISYPLTDDNSKLMGNYNKTLDSNCSEIERQFSRAFFDKAAFT